MLDKLKANQGKKVILELVTGRKIPGVVLAVDQNYVRVESGEGIGNIPVSSIYILWENLGRSSAREEAQVNDDIKQHYVCTSAQGFTCSPRYSCTPPHQCTMTFICQPGNYTSAPTACPGVPYTGTPSPQPGAQCPALIFCPVQFSGGTQPPGGMPGITASPAKADPPVCRPFQFGHCRPFEFGEHCRPFDFGHCGPFEFGHCGAFQFGQQPCFGAFACNTFQFSPCSFTFGCGPFQFGQPCSFAFGCGTFQFGQPCSPFVFGGSQCGGLGGFACAGQQFFGLVNMPAK